MGLAEPRKRFKLSHDPNNTKWTRDTSRFGHKIMASQGWQPGDLLGAKDAVHAEFHTAANASHIRVAVKDNNLGLGAKRGTGLAEGECTGLDVFQQLLGRLNGKAEDELAKEQKSREDLQRALYAERKLGSIRFVQGGYLVGDQIQELIDKQDGRVQRDTGNSLDDSTAAGAPRGSIHPVDTPISADAKAKQERKRRREEKKAKKSSGLLLEERLVSVKEEKPDERLLPDENEKARVIKPKKSKRVRTQEADAPIEVTVVRERKSQKKRRRKKERAQSPASSPVPTDVPDRPQPTLAGRHAVRSRNIAQKRLAVLDTASLNQIFMIKPQSS